MTAFPQEPSVSAPGPVPARQEKTEENVRVRDILIVDDDDLVRDSLAILLSREGYPTAVAANGFEALELLDTRRFGLVLCDLVMPGLSGRQVIEALRQNCRNESNRRTPVICMTGKSGHCPAPQTAKDLAIAGCLYKPFDDSRILELVQSSMGA